MHCRDDGSGVTSAAGHLRSKRQPVRGRWRRIDDRRLPTAVLGGADTGNDPSGSVNVTGWTWLYVESDGGDAHVWYVGDPDGPQTVPLNNVGGQGQSHYALYNPGTVQVPDGGATLGLFGLGMLGLGCLRRRKQVRRFG